VIPQTAFGSVAPSGAHAIFYYWIPRPSGLGYCMSALRACRFVGAVHDLAAQDDVFTIAE